MLNERQEYLNNLARLMAMMSHDLRQPARQVNQYTELLREDLTAHVGELPAGISKSVNYICQGTMRINRMIESLMHLARVIFMGEEGPRSGDAKVALEQAIGALKEDIDTSGASIKMFNDLPCVMIHQQGLFHILYNLISNAIKHKPADRDISIDVGFFRAPGDTGMIYVSDDGDGIKDEYKPRIFDLFYQCPDSKEGAGVGLAICKMIVESCGGTIALSEKAMSGTTIFFHVGLADESIG